MSSSLQSARQRRLAAIAALSLMVAACGGGSDTAAPPSSGTPPAVVPTPPASDAGASTPPTPPAQPPAPAEPPAPTSNFYHVEAYPTSLADLSAQLAAQGKAGSAFISAITTQGATNGTLYYKPAVDGTFGYLFGDTAGTVVDWMAQANRMGSQGYRYKSTYGGSGYLYVKNLGASTTYLHKGRELVAGAPITDFIGVLNFEGARGNRWLDILTLQAAPVPVFVSESGAGGANTYTYDYDLADSSIDSLMWKVNSMGASGYQYLGTYQWSGKSYRLFELSSAQTGAISYTFDKSTSDETLKTVADAMTAKAATGFMYWGDVSVTGGQSSSASAGAYRVYAKGAQSLIRANGIMVP